MAEGSGEETVGGCIHGRAAGAGSEDGSGEMEERWPGQWEIRTANGYKSELWYRRRGQPFWRLIAEFYGFDAVTHAQEYVAWKGSV